MFNLIILSLTLICSRPVAVIEGINCPPPVSEIQYILTTYYDPNKSKNNCDSDCGVLADSELWDKNDLGNVGACVSDWYYRTVVLYAPNQEILRLLCRDTGGGIVIIYDKRCDCWAALVDVLWDSEQGEFPYNGWIWGLPYWELK